VSAPGGPPDPVQPLAGLRIVEISSFVAVPLAGMTLAQLGAEVIRVDPIGGAADYHRWPVTADGASIYWTGLNKGKRSVAADMRSPEGQRLVARLILDSGPAGGILITNVAGREWHSYDTLVKDRPDLIHLEVLGRADGSTGVDYTVNAATGFPLVTGPAEYGSPVNHVLPAWDVACGLYAALAVTAASRHRDATGQGSRITLPLENVALATAGNLGFLTEAMVNGTQRERLGNSIYGQYGQDFTSSDGVSFMVVTLTGRHFRDLAQVTATTKVVAALADALDADFADEGDRYRHRDALTGVFTVWFREHSAEQIAAALAATSILWERYRSFGEVAGDARVTANPMFTALHQPRVGDYLAPGLPMSIDGAHIPAVAAPAVGDDTAAVLRERLGMGSGEIDRLAESGTVATTSSGDERLREEQKAGDERLREEQKAGDERLREEQKAGDERLREELTKEEAR
jgi:2-methylfumaryl-CoA isomerase